MIKLPTLLANLDYPSGPVCGIAIIVCLGFIIGGGIWFKRVEERTRNEREALKAGKPGPTNP